MDDKLRTDEIRKYIESSVLCWLATCSENYPSVSPKEIFALYDDNTIIIANIASPNSVKNIKRNRNVCVSFLDIFAQRGIQVYGQATILNQDSHDYTNKKKILQDLAGNAFTIASVIEIAIMSSKPILAPSYQFNATITEDEMIKNALATYDVTKR